MKNNLAVGCYSIDRINGVRPTLDYGRSWRGDNVGIAADQFEADRLRLENIANEIRLLARKLPEVEDNPLQRAKVENSDLDRDRIAKGSYVKRLIRNRRIRDEYFTKLQFADPAWDILLALFDAELSGYKVMVSGLCTSAAVPQTTALRWIGHLVELNIIEKYDDPTDRRRQFVYLKPDTSIALHRYFSRIIKDNA